MQMMWLSVFVMLVALGNSKAEIAPSIMKSFQKCLEKGGFNGVVNCAGLRTLNMMRSLTQKNTLEIIPGILLQRDESIPDLSRKIKEEDLPVNPVNRSERILELLGDETMSLFSRRTLTVKLPEIDSEEVSRGLKGEEEGW
ncbi:uncharacterized protein LOC123314344 [Coccinella septempunctata]|uniref:uncharacterized protein LOC123314344 n=1 Tax=Coccinella septempunctata TaxID=41139 RepID=UPI001D064266|nr:uncharacterized protein LOC123314344 [Coccinella septempunctata]